MEDGGELEYTKPKEVKPDFSIDWEEKLTEKERLRLTDDEFWNMTPYKFWLKQKGNIEDSKFNARPFAVLASIMPMIDHSKIDFTPNTMMMLAEEAEREMTEE